MDHTLNGLQDTIEIIWEVHLKWISFRAGRMDGMICGESDGKVDNNKDVCNWYL